METHRVVFSGSSQSHIESSCGEFLNSSFLDIFGILI